MLKSYYRLPRLLQILHVMTFSQYMFMVCFKLSIMMNVHGKFSCTENLQFIIMSVMLKGYCFVVVFLAYVTQFLFLSKKVAFI